MAARDRSRSFMSRLIVCAPDAATDIAARSAAQPLLAALYQRLRQMSLTRPTVLRLVIEPAATASGEYAEAGDGGDVLILRTGLSFDQFAARHLLAHELAHILVRRAREAGLLPAVHSFHGLIATEYLAERLGWELLVATSDPSGVATRVLAQALLEARLPGLALERTVVAAQIRAAFARSTDGIMADPADVRACARAAAGLFRTAVYDQALADTVLGGQAVLPTCPDLSPAWSTAIISATRPLLAAGAAMPPRPGRRALRAFGDAAFGAEAEAAFFDVVANALPNLID